MREVSAQNVSRAVFRLQARYPRTDLGNPSDPLDDLIYIILSGQTNESNCLASYRALKRAYPDWLAATKADVHALALHIDGGGLAVQKADYIHSILQTLTRDFGRPTLLPLQGKETNEIEQYLTKLHGVAVKSARCVLMYAFHREVFPADVHCLRIMERLGWLQVGGRRAELMADEAQEIVPPALRRDFHIALVQHGRQICTPTNPKCGECHLLDMCDHAKAKKIERPTVVDLCCGAGGFSWGFLQAGYEILLGVDTSSHALKTFSENIHAPTLNQDISEPMAVGNIRKGIHNKRPSVVIAGPPCQGFSRAGDRDPRDDRNGLFKAAIKVAVALNPDVIAFENVLNLRAPAFVHHFRQAKGVLRRAGYGFQDVVVHAEAFGVPQSRRRVVLIATKRQMREELKAVLERLGNRPSVPGLNVATALEGLSLNCDVVTFIPNHVPMRHAERVIEKIKRIAPGTGPLSYRKLHPERSAQTLVCGHRALPCHFGVPRTITAREAARIQGFPDNFKFLGSKGSQMQQVANAVPPRLALGVAVELDSLMGNWLPGRVKSLLDKVLTRGTFWPPPCHTMATPSICVASPLQYVGNASEPKMVAKSA